MPANKLNDAEIEEALAGLDGWSREGDEIVREVQLADFVAAMGLITQVGILAERMNHHPTLTNTWNRVHIALSTHDVGGISDYDMRLAAEINERVG
ncbi:MAG: 4a-hydroxytetrahydrobiopterin dehydratase [Chloroflexota bacterium]|nr:4a-hydroxytetrahydrobiopterin dehydratase [Chloroflexota bacterium]MDE2695127.1 4a-hydroxytetrahydrobiopterin dehydratase [Chloroflexota bacterium]